MTSAVSRNRKAQQAAETRALLLAAARALFGERGYAATSIDEIAARVGVTIGALYHHFPDKRSLFRAVYEQIETELGQKVVAGVQERTKAGADAWEEVHAGCDALLDAALDPAIQRIIYLEAPSVLGWDGQGNFARYGLGLIREGLRRAIDQGIIPDQPVEPLAHLIRAVLLEAATLIARSEDHASARASVGPAVRRLIDGVRT